MITLGRCFFFPPLFKTATVWSGAGFHTMDANWQSYCVSDAASDEDNDLQAKIGRQGWLQGQRQRLHKHTHLGVHTPTKHITLAIHLAMGVAHRTSCHSKQMKKHWMGGICPSAKHMHDYICGGRHMREADPETLQPHFSEHQRAVMHFYLKY